MNLQVSIVDRDDAAPRFASLGLADGCLDRCRFFRLADDAGREIGVYALEIRGPQGWLVAGLGGHPDIDLTAEFLPFIEAQLMGCDALYIQTGRAGLIRKLAASGYRLDTSILFKPL